MIVLKPSTTVFFTDREGEKDVITAYITQVCIRSDLSISYEIAWWAGRTRNVAWVSEKDIKAMAHSPRLEIGFIEDKK